ncbi:MAG: hypothetical protein ACRYF2_14090 [Janthinobacterium lividum]
MPTIPASLTATILLYWPALLALVVAAAIGWASRGKSAPKGAPKGGPKGAQKGIQKGAQKGFLKWGRTGASLACLAGWAALEPVAGWRGAALSPGFGAGMLLVPAAGVAAIEALQVWRAGRNERWLGFAATALVGWWLARSAAVAGEFWRVWIVIGLLVAVVAWVVRQQSMRGMALSLALWGGMLVVGFPVGWLLTAAVLAAASAGLLASGSAAAIPSALVAAVLAGADLARGRATRGHLDGADIVCLLALAAPLVAALVQPRLSKRVAILAPFVGAAVAVALAWGLRRVVL